MSMLSTVCIMGKLGSIPIRDGKGNRLMGIMATFCGVHIVMAMGKKWVFFSPFHSHCRQCERFFKLMALAQDFQ